jgi:hypothetical protein
MSFHAAKLQGKQRCPLGDSQLNSKFEIRNSKDLARDARGFVLRCRFQRPVSNF